MNEDESRRSSQWWREVERHVDAAEAAYADDDQVDRDASLPDPWSHLEVDLVSLTEEQAALLAGDDDQPPVVRLTDDQPPGGDGREDDRPEDDRPDDDGPDDQPPRPRVHG